jgi:serpin B
MMWFVVVAQVCLACVYLTNSAAVDTGLSKEIENGHYNLALNLNKELYKTDGSKDYVFFSPVNIQAALAVVTYPSGGQTRKQLLDLMGLSSTHDWNSLHTNLANLFTQAQQNQYANMSICEGIFVNNGFPIKDEFKKFAVDVYKSEVANVDFQNKGQETMDFINNWVSQHTQGRIKKVCEKPYDPDTVVVLANALYFHANWQNPFSSVKTHKGQFNENNGQVSQVMYMTQISGIQYLNHSEGKFEAIGIPYKDDEFTMYCLRPHDGQTLGNLIQTLNRQHLTEIVNATLSSVQYSVPHFELKYKADLAELLKTLGATQLFTDLADFQGLSDNVKVSKVTHVVDLKVNEEGTIGSAVTTFEFVTRAGRLYDVDFILNKPYLFFIYQPKTNLIVFLGSINKPTPLTQWLDPTVANRLSV